MSCKKCAKIKKLRLELRELKIQIKLMEECKNKWEETAKQKNRKMVKPIITITAPGSVIIETIQVYE